MLPKPSDDTALSMGAANAKPEAYVGIGQSGRPEAPHFEYVTLGEPGLRATLAPGLPVLRDHVGRVVGIGTGEEVPGIDTERVVASVAYSFRGIELPDEQLEGQPMSKDRLALDSAGAVTLRLDATLPRPAILGRSCLGVIEEVLHRIAHVEEMLRVHAKYLPARWAQNARRGATVGEPEAVAGGRVSLPSEVVLAPSVSNRPDPDPAPKAVILLVDKLKELCHIVLPRHYTPTHTNKQPERVGRACLWNVLPELPGEYPQEGFNGGR